MSLPEGQPCFDRVVMTIGDPLADALDRELSGYGVVIPQAGLLGDGAGKGVVWFEMGVPVGARHTGSGRTGGAALADIAETGPYRVRLVGLDSLPETAHQGLAPGAPAERLAGDEALASRTRSVAEVATPEAAEAELDAVEAFLADEEKIEAIQQQAQAEAKRRAEEWGFDTTD